MKSQKGSITVIVFPILITLAMGLFGRENAQLKCENQSLQTGVQVEYVMFKGCQPIKED